MSEGENGTTAESQEQEYIRDPILDTEEMRKIYVRGIPNDKKEEELKAFFDEISGESVEAQIITNKDAKKNNFGFVTFEKSETVDEILLKRKELNFHGRVLDVNRAVPKNTTTTGALEKIKKLFVANLPKFNCCEEDLRKYFEERHPKKYGTIESIQLIKKKDAEGNKLEENKGYGFIIVSSEDMADKMAIQHATFDFGGRRVELKKSVSNNQTGGGGRGRGAPQGGYGNYGPGDYQGGYGGWGGNWYDYGGWGDGYGGYGGGYGPMESQGGGAGRGAGRGQPYPRYNPYPR